MEVPENQALESFYAALRNLDKQEREEFREIIKSMFNPTLRERYLTVNYHRAAFNVEMMLGIKDTKQFQTLSLLARAIFELAMEIKSIVRDPDAAKKIELFSKVEVLKAARQVVGFYDGRPEADLYQKQVDFIKNFGAQIDAKADVMWPPNPRTGKKQPVKHWTLTNARQRAKGLGAPFDRIYEAHYPQLSWMTHSGVVSPLNMTTEWVSAFVSVVYSIAIDSYVEILDTLAVEFKLSTTNEHIRRKILCNRDLGATRTKEEGMFVLAKHGLASYFEPPELWREAKPRTA
jgi:hypothetical protein